MTIAEIDAKTGKLTEGGGGVSAGGFCSWRRLREVFRDAKELKPGEELISYKLDEHGIHYRVRTRR